MAGPNGTSGGSVTYAEVRRWAAWLQVFTASDLADALHASHEVGVRGVKALLHQGICEDSGDTLDGSYGPERLIEYIPLPPGPREHPTEAPPEVVVPREMGGDPLKVRRGLPVGQGRKINGSVVGQRRPGRRQMTREERVKKLGK